MKKILLIAVFFFGFLNTVQAALPVAVYEVRSSATANNVNGGGFNSARGGTDYTLQDAAQVHSTDGASTASTTFTSATGGFTDAMKGNFLHLISATGADELVGWYEIVSVTDGNNVVLDRVSGTYTLANFYMGGAISLASTLDDDFFEILIAGSTVWIKNGSYTLGEALVIAADGTSALPVYITGYNSSRADDPTESNRPTLVFGGNAATIAGQFYQFKNFIITTTQASGFSLASGCSVENCKITNSSGSAGFYALLYLGNVMAINCELVSTNGIAVGSTSGTASPIYLLGSYIHDSVTGVGAGTSDEQVIAFNIIDNCTTGLSFGNLSSGHYVLNNTIYGAETPAGTGILQASTTGVNCLFYGNIIYGFTTGASAAAVVGSNFWDFNDFYNNTTDRTNVTAGTHDLAVDPTFTSAAAGDFSIGSPLKSGGFPGGFPGALSTGHLDVGAVQREEPAGSVNVLGEVSG